MRMLRAYGIELGVPTGCDGRIFRRAPGEGERTYPVAHLATFPLPAQPADFGGGIVEQMGPDDFFLVLFEYGPESVGAPLFSGEGIPQHLRSEHFKPHVLRRGVGGQSGTQWFFVEAGRPFTLYAVLGSHAMRNRLVPRVNGVLAGITIDRTAVVPGAAPA